MSGPANLDPQRVLILGASAGISFRSNLTLTTTVAIAEKLNRPLILTLGTNFRIRGTR